MAGDHGKFVWYELMTTDAASAETFYTDVVGWSARDSGMPGVTYTLFTMGEAMVAGLMTLPEAVEASGGRPGWIGYVAVDDVDAGAAKVKTLGGAVHRAPEDIPGIGRFAVVADPHGAVFQLFRPDGPPPGPPAANDASGQFGWRELMSADWEQAWPFYAAMFGWTKSQPIDMGPMGTYQIFAHGGEDVGALMTKPPEVPAPHWGYYMNVPAIDAAAGRIKAGGGQIVMEPMLVPTGQWVLNAIDPQGAHFGLVAPVR